MSPVRCGGAELPEYAVGRLSLSRTRAWDRHLVACARCLAEVANERILHQRLTSGPTPSGDLRSALLAMAASTPDAAPGDLARCSRRSESLAVLSPTDPPTHRSVLRSVVLASSVAGLGVCAVWSLAVVGRSAATAPAVSVVPHIATTKRPESPRPTFVSLQWQPAHLGGSIPDARPNRAESTP